MRFSLEESYMKGRISCIHLFFNILWYYSKRLKKRNPWLGGVKMSKFVSSILWIFHIWLLSQHRKIVLWAVSLWLYRVSSDSCFSPSINWVGLIERWEQYIRDTKVSSILRIFRRYMFASSISKTNLLSIICFGLLRP